MSKKNFFFPYIFLLVYNYNRLGRCAIWIKVEYSVVDIIV